MSDEKPSHYVKLSLPVEGDDGSFDIESVWATAEDTGYRIDNIPFYVRGYAWGDVISAMPDPDGMLRVTRLVTASGHSTVRLWFGEDHVGDVQKVRDKLRAMRCDSEVDLARLVAVDIPPDVPYAQIRQYLEELVRTGVLEYEEACLGQLPAS